jgi:Leucine Rich repeat
MRFPRVRFTVRRVMVAVAVLGLLSAWPGRRVYQSVLRRKTIADILGNGGSVNYREGGLGVFFGKADPQNLWLFKDAAAVDLAGTEASDADLEPLRDSKSLVFLNLTGCRITDDGLAKLKGIANLKYLFVGDTKVTNEGLKQISGLSGLEILVLDNTRISDPGLAGLERMGKLRELSLWGTLVSDRGTFRLRSSPALKSVSLPRSDAGSSNLAELQKELPGVAVYRQPTTIPH